MATLKLHYDGWLTLPAGLRDLLDLKTGDHLQAELVDGAIVLRPTHGKRVPAEPEPAAAMPVVATAAAADTVAAPVKRPRGRPRKVQADPSQAELLPGLEVPGPTEAQAWPAAESPPRCGSTRTSTKAGSSGDEAVVWKLRPKAALPETSPEPVPNPLPSRRREPRWTEWRLGAGGAPAIPQCRGPQAGARAAAQPVAADNRQLAEWRTTQPSMATRQ